MPMGIVDRVLRQLGDVAETGVLFLQAAGETDQEIHLSRGRSVGCASAADEWLLARRLEGTGLLRPEDIKLLCGEDVPLHEAVLTSGLVGAGPLGRLQAERFRDNFHFACVTPWQTVEFLRLGCLAEAASLGGEDPSALLVYVAAWRREIGEVLTRWRTAPAVRAVSTLDPRGISGEASWVLAQMTGFTRLDEVLATSPIERYRTLAVLARLSADGSVCFEDEDWIGAPEPTPPWI